MGILLLHQYLLAFLMRVIAKRTIKTFWEKPGSEDAHATLEAWHDITIKALWQSPQDIKNQFGNASICGNTEWFLISVETNTDWLLKSNIGLALFG